MNNANLSVWFITNLIEYLNRNYLNDNILEEEVSTITKTLYDPEVEKRGIEKGIQQGVMNAKLENARNVLDILDDETISAKLGIDLEIIKKIRLESNN